MVLRGMEEEGELFLYQPDCVTFSLSLPAVINQSYGKIPYDENTRCLTQVFTPSIHRIILTFRMSFSSCSVPGKVEVAFLYLSARKMGKYISSSPTPGNSDTVEQGP